MYISLTAGACMECIAQAVALIYGIGGLQMRVTPLWLSALQFITHPNKILPKVYYITDTIIVTVSENRTAWLA